MTRRDREKPRDKSRTENEEEVPLHREPRDEEPFSQRRSDEVPDADHVITKQPAHGRREVDRDEVEEEPTGS